MHSPPKRTTAEIEAYRGQMRHVMAQSDYRALTSARDRVLFLSTQHQALPQDICHFTGTPLTTVRRWVSSPEKGTKRGRPPYLTPELEYQLFQVTVMERFNAHKPMNNLDIVAEARNHLYSPKKKICLAQNSINKLIIHIEIRIGYEVEARARKKMLCPTST
jgi:hypothetical protein